LAPVSDEPDRILTEKRRDFTGPAGIVYWLRRPPRHRSAGGGLRKYLTRQGRGEARTGALQLRSGSWRARTATCPRTRGARRRRRRRVKGRARRRTRERRRAGRPHRARPTVPPRPHEGERIASAAAAIAGGRRGEGSGSRFLLLPPLFFPSFRWVSFSAVRLRRWVVALAAAARWVMVCGWPTTETETGWAAVEVEQTCIASGGFVFRFRFRYRLLLVVFRAEPIKSGALCEILK
jgi:hypothetical protein